jgi:pheromone shutdown protein TraB
MDLMDPQIVKKGIEDIKEQMRDMQKEAVNIETDLERRFHAMQTKTQQQRYLPQSLTEEFD